MSTTATATVRRLSPPSLDTRTLPTAVARLRTRILEAASSGDIGTLLIPVQWNEVPPLFIRDQPRDFDPIAYLKTRSFDGRGLEMLRVIRAVFLAPSAKATMGATETYVWPVFPPVLEPTPWPQERLAPWSCVRFADLRATTPNGTPLVHHTAIGVDGTWHYFWTEPDTPPLLAPGPSRR